MARLIYMNLTSLDGYIEDEQGDFRWAEPDEEVHAFVNDLMRPVGTHLYGRRLYETMAVWETDSAFALEAEVTRDFAEVWQGADKIVYSSTLQSVPTTKTSLRSTFDAEEVAHLKATATGDLTIGGAELAAHAWRAGLVDECHLLVAPVVVGGGKRALPNSLHAPLELLDERRFASSGVVYLRYRVLN